MRESVVRDNNVVALCKKMNEYRQNDDVYSDIEISVQGKSFKCHRIVLSAASNVFHMMFIGGLEVTLDPELTADTFEKMLEFIYTGDVSITSSTNLYELFFLSETYKLPGLEEACVQHIREYSSSLAKYAPLQLYPFFRMNGKEEAIKVLDQSIFHRFDHFSGTHEFLNLSFDDLNRILKQLETHSPVNHDVFHDAIMRWTTYTFRYTRYLDEQIKNYCGQLMKYIDFTKLSGNYMKCMAERYVKFGTNNVSNASSSNDEIALSNAEKSRMPPTLHVFAVSQHNDRTYSSADVFSSYEHFDFHKWIHSFSFDQPTSLPDFVRTVEVNNYLYCLSYTYDTTRELSQKFITTSSISLFPESYLTPPPRTMYNFDMCKIHGNIYVYNKDAPSRLGNVKNSENFDEEALLRGVYLYNTEINKWLPVPPLKKRFVANACMTSDEQNRLYLIGGTNSNGYAQAYDHRTSQWIALAPTSGIFDRAACCVSQEKVYVSGGCNDPGKVEMYDPTAAAWTTLPNMNLNLMDHEMLVDEDGHCITYAKYLNRRTGVDIFRIDGSWTSCIFDDLKKASSSLDNVEIIHMTPFKPYGF